MKAFNDIKSVFEQKNYNKKDLNIGIFLFSILKMFFSKISILLFSTIPFFIGLSLVGFSTVTCLFYLVIHLAFYHFYVQKVYKNELEPIHNELGLTVKALKEIKSVK
jgi:hypothetical protein